MQNSDMQQTTQSGVREPIQPYTGLGGLLIFAILYIMIRKTLLAMGVYVISYRAEWDFFGGIFKEIQINVFYLIIYGLIVTFLFTTTMILDYLLILPDIRTVEYLKDVFMRNFVLTTVFMTVYYFIALSSDEALGYFFSFGDWFLLLVVALVIIMGIAFGGAKVIVNKNSSKFFELKENPNIMKINKLIQGMLNPNQ